MIGNRKDNPPELDRGVKKTAEQRGFEAFDHVSHKAGKPFRPLVDRLFSRWVSSAHLDGDWATDADWARMQQEPIRGRAFLYLVTLSVIGLVVWAGFAQIVQVTKGQGRVVPSSDVKSLASVDGGVVSRVYVDEGMLVEAGQLLMRIDPTRAQSKLGESVARSLALKAKAERLRALTTGTSFKLPEKVNKKAPKLASQSHELYETSLQELHEAQQIAREQYGQHKDKLKAVQARYRQASRSLNLASQELQMTKPLLAAGAVSKVEILRLRREVSNARGERSQAKAEIARIKGMIDEARNKVKKVELEIKNDWRQKLSKALSQLAALKQGKVGLRDRVQSTAIRSPVDGIVQKLYVTTIGGVVRPGQQVVSIVPTGDKLVIEAHIEPQDIAFLHPGQQAFVTFTAYDYTTYGGMEAMVTHISADTVTDDRDRTYYVVRVRTQKPALGKGLNIIPGMTARVNIRTGMRTVLQYLLQPLLHIKHNALE